MQGDENKVAQWRPIETAPKDGTRILVWTIHDEVEVSEWYEIKGNDYEPVEGSDLFRRVTGKVFNEGWNSNTPTHWMPLPDAPSSVADSSADSPSGCEGEAGVNQK